jgi:hypothetical protein
LAAVAFAPDLEISAIDTATVIAVDICFNLRPDIAPPHYIICGIDDAKALQLTLLVSAVGSGLLLLGSVLAVWAKHRRIQATFVIN